jgi:capsular polysaccharide transport system permease protein
VGNLSVVGRWRKRASSLMTIATSLPLRRKTTFYGSLQIQFRVIGALFMRDIIAKFGRHGLGFLWLFLEPMMFAIGVTIIWSFTAHSQGNIPVAAFILTGYSALVLWRNLVNRLMAGVASNKGLLYHRNVKVIDLLYARSVMEFAACTISFVLLSFIFAALGLMTLPDDPLKTLIGWVLYAWFSFAFGLVAAYMGSSNEIFDRVAHILMYLSMPLTGGFAMVTWLPPDVQNILLMSPLVNAIELLREGYFGMSVKAEYSVSYILVVNLCLTLAGLILVRSIKRQLIDS